MFLRIVYVYLVFKHSQLKPKPFGIKINIDLEAAGVEKKIIYMVYFHPLWIENSVVTHSPLLPPKKAKSTR